MNTVGVYITTRCNLKCKRCLLHIPYLKEQRDSSMEVIQETFDKLFCITDRIEKVILSGGETFLFVGLDRLLDWLFEEYGNRIGKIELFSNGTVVPERAVVDQIKRFGTDREKVFIDDYGPELSWKVKEMMELFDECGISYEVKNYTPVNTHCGGWVDYGDLRVKKHTYAEESKVKDWKHSCVYLSGYRSVNIYEGKVYSCSQARVQSEMGFNDEIAKKSLDLFDPSISIEERKRWFAEMEEAKYYAACDYCSGMTENSERYVPAEQLTEEEMKMVRCGARSTYEIEEMKKQQ